METEIKLGEQANTVVLQDVAITKPTTTEFGFSSISKPTPVAAKNFYIFYMGMNTSLLAFFAATSLFTKETNAELICIFKFLIDPLAYCFMKMWGVVPIDSIEGQDNKETK